VISNAVSSIGGCFSLYCLGLIVVKGWTKMTTFSDLDAMDDDDWDRVRSPLLWTTTADSFTQCWTTNVKSSWYLFKEALPTFNANPDGGVFIITSSTAVGSHQSHLWFNIYCEGWRLKEPFRLSPQAEAAYRTL
jgi:NAD(P)-dependent dehydrogenase (short-subunit alcohol dehydrogenase family)